MYVIKTSHNHYIKWHIQRPDRFNALGPIIGRELLDSLNELSKNDLKNSHTRMLAITAETVKTRRGPIWVAGGDLKELSQLKGSSEAFAYGELFQNILEKLRSLPIPVVFVINGQAIGGGVELTLGGDLRIGTQDSSFHFKQTAVGLATGYGGSAYLKELVGSSRAAGWLLMNQTLNANEALQQGLIHQVISKEEIDETLETLSLQFSKQSPRAIDGQKKMLNRPSPQLKADLKEELREFSEIWGNDHHKKFLSKYS